MMSKMGISVLSSYRGGCNFEAVGLSRSLVQEFFPGMPSRLSGIGLRGIQEKIARQHARAFDEDVIALPIGGFYKTRHGGDRHNFEGNLIHMLQDAVNTESFAEVHAATASRCAACRRSTCATCSTSGPTARRSPSTRSNRSPSCASGWSRPASRWARWGPRRTRPCRSP